MPTNNLIDLALKVKEMRLWQQRYLKTGSAESLAKVSSLEKEVDIEVTWILDAGARLNRELKKWNGV